MLAAGQGVRKSCGAEASCGVRLAQLPVVFSGVLPGLTCSSDYGAERSFSFRSRREYPQCTSWYIFRDRLLMLFNELCVVARMRGLGSDFYPPCFSVSRCRFIMCANDANCKFGEGCEDVFWGSWWLKRREVSTRSVISWGWRAVVPVPTVPFLPDIPKICCKAGLKISPALVLIREKSCNLCRKTSRIDTRLLAFSDELVILARQFCYKKVDA